LLHISKSITFFNNRFLILCLILFLLSTIVFLPISAYTKSYSNIQNLSSLNYHTETDLGNPKIEYKLSKMLSDSEENEVMVSIELDSDYVLHSGLLEVSGFRVHRFYDNLVQGNIDPKNIEIIADLPFVNFVHEPIRSFGYNTISEGVSFLKADIAQSIGQTGSGAKVAVIDGGFNISNIEISQNIQEFRSFRFDDSIEGDNPAHGTACAEIIVDVAPDVELYLFTIDTDLDFISAVNYAVSLGVDIISISVGFYNLGAYDGSSSVSEVLELARNSGVLPITAAGNEANKHWSGVFSDSDLDDWHNFDVNDETNSFDLDEGETVIIYLSWNDWISRTQDYDIYLYKDGEPDLELVDYSNNRQSGFRRPTESIFYTADSTDTYHISIFRDSANINVMFDLYILGGSNREYIVSSGSISNVPDSKGSLSVGALNWVTGDLESFSSRGPTADGRLKPDITGPDGVSTTSYSGGFFGTSAAAPHVAGIAALIVGSNPSISANALASIIESTAVDLGDQGKDNLYGSGKAEAKYLTLDVSPRIVSIIAGNDIISPQFLPRQFLVDDSVQTISLSTISVTEDDSRFVFKKWSDGSISPVVELFFDGTWTNKVAEFNEQYLLTIQSQYGNPVSEDWFDGGAQASFSISPFFDHGNGTRRVFTSWTGAVTGSNPSASIIMNSPKVVSTQWKKQYELVIESPDQSSTGQGWYDSGSMASFSVIEESVSTNDTRRVFKRWSGDFIGSNLSGTILMNSPKTIESIWDAQYLLSIDAPHQAAFVSGGWFNQEEIVMISGKNIWNNVLNSTRSVIQSILIDENEVTEARTNADNFSLVIIMDQPHKVQIIEGLQFFFDISGGNNVEFEPPSPTRDSWWDNGQSIMVSTDNVWRIINGDSRLNLMAYTLDGNYVEISRSNASRFNSPEFLMNGPRSFHFISVNQYLFDIEGGHQVQSTLSPTSDYWFDAGAIIDVSSQSFWYLDQEGSRIILGHWQLDEDDIQEILRSEEERFIVVGISMNAPHKLSFISIIQYHLEVVSELNIPLGSGWYDEGVTAIIEVQSISKYDNQTRHVFVSWSGDIVSDESSTTIVMNSPMKAEAQWKTQYFFQIKSRLDSFEGGGWYDRGSQAIFRVIAPVEWTNNTRSIFTGWSGFFQGDSIEGSIIIDFPTVVEANWRTQYLLEVLSSFGEISGGGWYNRGELVSLQVPEKIEHENFTRHVPSGWMGDIITDDMIVVLSITEPFLVEVNWRTQYYLEVKSSIGETDGDDWYDRGEIAHFSVQSEIDWGNQTRSVFLKWIGDVELVEPEGSLMILSPQKILALWKIQYLTSLVFLDNDANMEILPSSVQLIGRNGGKVILQDFNSIWFDDQDFSINEILWMGVDVKQTGIQPFLISEPGELRILTETYPLRIIVRDLLSFPVSGASIFTEFANGTIVQGFTDQAGEIQYSLIPLGDYSSTIKTFGQNVNVIGDASINDELNVMISVSLPIFILIGVSISSAIGAYYMVKIRKNPKRFLMISFRIMLN